MSKTKEKEGIRKKFWEKRGCGRLSPWYEKVQRERTINNGNSSEWSLIRSVNIPVIEKIGRLRRGSLICQSRVWLQTELDDTKSCYQLITTLTISPKKKRQIHLGQTSPEEIMSRVKISSILKILQFLFYFRISGCWDGYCDQFCDCWF